MGDNGCPDTDTDTDTDTDVPCEWGDAEPGASVSMSMEFDGEDRSFEVHLPSNYDCTTRPLIIGLHGYYGSGTGFERSTSQMFDRIDELGYIGLFPDGTVMGTSGWKRWVTSFNDVDSHNSDGPDGATCTDNAYDYGVFENCSEEESQDACNWGTSCSDDEGFVRAALAHVQEKWTVDAARVYLTGFSQGGQTTQSLAWRLADVLAAAAPHHGFAANGYTQGPETALGLFQVWGSEDRTVDGNERASSDGMIYDGAEETLTTWAAAQDCDSESSPYTTDYDGTSGWSCIKHANCSTGAQVVSCVWEGGHNWGRGGGTNFALESMLEFFVAHSR
jgi:polyhydroxybutyrate depolymerase